MKTTKCSAHEWQVEMTKLISGEKSAKNGFATLEQGMMLVRGLTDELLGDPEKLGAFLETGGLLRESNHRRRTQAERDFMRWVQEIAREAYWNFREGAPDIGGGAATEAAAQLSNFAIRCLSFARKNDRWTDWRRGEAFQILTRFIDQRDLTEVSVIARDVIRGAESAASAPALKFIAEYHLHKDQDFDKQLVEDLKALAEKTDDESTAFQVLEALVDNGEISELGALDRLNDWRESHR